MITNKGRVTYFFDSETFVGSDMAGQRSAVYLNYAAKPLDSDFNMSRPHKLDQYNN
jgi:hypothetical protein